MRNGFSNARQVVDLDDLFPVSAPLVEVNWVEGRVGAITKEAGILRRTEDVGAIVVSGEYWQMRKASAGGWGRSSERPKD